MKVGDYVRFDAFWYLTLWDKRVENVGPHFSDEYVEELKEIQDRVLIISEVRGTPSEELISFEGFNFFYPANYFYKSI